MNNSQETEINKDKRELKKASQGYDFEEEFSLNKINCPKDNSFNLLCKKNLYRIFPILCSLVKALTSQSLIHPYFCVKSISYR